ncbi:MAG: DUF2271 domain-containing protein, partial [Planctomycetaceae bacterium]|nr:DUF2271 domain-containing protein [Planctomycetaceae bacterium]
MHKTWVLAIVLFSTTARAEEFRFPHENVLGTVAEFHIHATSQTVATSTEKALLSVIDRLAAIYSTYDPQSEIRLWMASQLGPEISPELFELLKLSEKFQNDSNEAFNPRVAQATSLWREAVAKQRLPQLEALQQTVLKIKQPAWKLDEKTRTAKYLGEADCRLTFDAIAKGLIIDKATEVALKQHGVQGVVVNIGGDLRVAGNISQRVSIAASDNESEFIGTLQVRNRSVATSGNAHKFFEIGDKRYSHILDPRTAKPVQQTNSVTVLADSAAAADAMATALSTLSPSAAVHWCNQHEEFECLIVDAQGQLHKSRQFPEMDPVQTQFVAAVSEGEEWSSKSKLTVSFELNRANGSRYRRPYVAVWVEDKDGFPVRTLVLWLQEGRGARWYRDLKRWYKQDSIRQLVEEKKLIGTISAATKPPGKYKAVWDGKDNAGKLVKKGKYTLYIEAAREHGTYQL